MRTTFAVHPAAVLQTDKTQEEECGKLTKFATMLALMTRGASGSTENKQNSALVPDTASALTADSPGVELRPESQLFAGSTAIDAAASAQDLTQADNDASLSAGAVSEASDAAGTSTNALPQRAPNAITFIRFLQTSLVKYEKQNVTELFSFYFENPRTMLEDGFIFMQNDEDFQGREFRERAAKQILKMSATTFGILVLYMVKGTIYSKLKRAGDIVADAFWSREDLTFKEKIRRVVEEATGKTYLAEEQDDKDADEPQTVDECLPPVRKAFKATALMMI